MQIEYVDAYDVNMCNEHPSKIFVFGDNLDRHGRGGQAIIRYQHNSIGIATKRYASMKPGSFFTDKECERQHVLNDLRLLYSRAKGRTIVFPAAGIGTGRARMKETSPILYDEMCEILKTHFGVINEKA